MFSPIPPRKRGGECLRRVLLAATMLMSLRPMTAVAGELPTLHLRKAAAPPAMPTSLNDPSQAAGWYSASPTWFGNGGLDGSRTHVEVLATYDANALYLAFLVIDRSHNFALYGPDPMQCSRNAVWIQTPQGRTFAFIPQLNGYYPAGGMANLRRDDQPRRLQPRRQHPARLVERRLDLRVLLARHGDDPLVGHVHRRARARLSLAHQLRQLQPDVAEFGRRRPSMSSSGRPAARPSRPSGAGSPSTRPSPRPRPPASRRRRP